MKVQNIVARPAPLAGLMISTSLLAFAAVPANAQDSPEEIVVTGTRVANRTATESLSPVDVFSTEEISRQGSTDTNDILRTLVPSFNISRNAIADGSTFVRPPTLRGLPPDQTLVLVNGKRRHRSALVQLGAGALAAGAQAVDLAQIPGIAIERLEVLRDGASAQYGSDAIAGVINIQLKDQAEGGSASVQYGSTYEGDGDALQVQGNIGLPLGPEGFFNVSAEYTNSEPTNRGVQSPNAVEGAPNPVMNWGDPDAEAKRLFINAGIDVTDTQSIFLFGNYGMSKSNGSFVYRPPTNAVNGPTLPVPGDPDGFRFTEFFPVGFTPRFYGDIKDASITAGYDQEFDSGFRYELSGSFGRSQLEYELRNTVNPSLGPDSPTEFYVGRLVQEETGFNADFAYPIEVGLASPLNFAFGAEWRREQYEITPGDPESYAVGPYATFTDLVTGLPGAMAVGSNGYPGFRPEDSGEFKRDNYAVYVDTETDIFDGFTVGAAARYEDFDFFGSTFNWKLSTRYEFADWFSIRGSVNTGFRVPTPGQSQTSSVQTAFNAGSADPVARGTYPAAGVVAQYFGAEELSPEESFNIAVGFVADLPYDITLTVDYYNIEVEDRIALSGNFDVTTADRAALAALGVPGANTLGQVNYFTNAFDTRTQGVDVVANTSYDIGTGKLNLTAALNYNQTKVIERDPTVIDDERMADLEDQLPKWRGNLTGVYSLGPWSFLTRASYYGKWEDVATYGKSFGAEWVVDAEASYTFDEWVTLSIGAQNILDAYPDELNTNAQGTFNNGQVYPDASPIGYNGGFWYARITATF